MLRSSGTRWRAGAPEAAVTRRRLTAALACIVGVALVGWLWLFRDDPALRVSAPSPSDTPVQALPRVPALRPPDPGAPEPRPTSAPRPTPAPNLSPEVNTASDGRPFMAAGSDDHSDHEPKHPHPITQAHARIYRENNLSAAMAGAMNVADYQGLRALVEEYRLDYPEDTYRLQEGYALIADCLEQLTPTTQARAREYWKLKRGSPLRRFIRRHCLARPTIAG